MIDFKNLVAFPSSLISHFEAEASIHNYPEGSLRHAFHGGMQLVEMYDAYLYGQNHILTSIQTQGIQAITTEWLEKELLHVHQLMAATLGKDHGFTSGAYIPASDVLDDQVNRWHPTYGALPFIVKVVGTIIPGEEGQQLLDQREDYIVSKFPANKNELHAFFKLAEKFHEPASVAQDNRDEIVMERGWQVIQKMNKASFDGTLNVDDSKIMGNIVTIVDSRKVPAQMKKFFEETVKMWKSCPSNDIKKISTVLAQTFYGFTDIHPFVNGNGRMATLLINIMLRSLGQPSILLREPGDKQNRNSTYTKAIDGLTKHDWKPLAEHIEHRLTLACNNKPSEDQAHVDKFHECVAFSRMQLAQVLQGLEKEFPEFKLEAYFNALMVKDGPLNEHDAMSFLNKQMDLCDKLAQKYDELNLQKMCKTLGSITRLDDWCGAPDNEGVKFCRVMQSPFDLNIFQTGLSAYPELVIEEKLLSYTDDKLPLVIIKSSLTNMVNIEKTIQQQSPIPTPDIMPMPACKQ